MKAFIVAVLAFAMIGLIAVPTPAGAKCARVYLAPQTLTHPADVIPAGGGVLVGWQQSTSERDERFSGGDPALHTDWRFLIRKRKVRPKVEQLAPGLVVYRPGVIRSSKPEKIVLAEKDGARVGTFKASRKKSAFTAAAPSPSKVVVTRYEGGRWGEDVNATVELSAAPPASAVALILYRDDKPLSWASVKGVTATSVQIYASDGHCGASPSGMTEPAPGDKVTLAWVDGFGRLSGKSAAIAVTAGKP